MATKFYLHDAATTDTGTLPSGFNSINGTQTSSVNVPGADTDRQADTTIGVAVQNSGALTTLANTNAQRSMLRRFVSSPIAAQTIASQVLTYGVAANESNTNSNFGLECRIGLWRPSSGALVGMIKDPQTLIVSTNMTTSEAWTAATMAASLAQTSQDGDILVFELWRDGAAQGMSTAYTNTVFYDGTTEGSATTPASYINFPNTITFFTPPAIPDVVMSPSRR